MDYSSGSAENTTIQSHSTEADRDDDQMIPRSHPGHHECFGRRLVGSNRHHPHPSLRYLRQRDDRHHTAETSVRLVSHERLPDGPGPVRHRHAVQCSSTHVVTEGAGLRYLRQSRDRLQAGHLDDGHHGHVVGLAPRGSHRPASRLRRLAPPRQRHLYTSQKCRHHSRYNRCVQFASLTRLAWVQDNETVQRDHREVYLWFHGLSRLLGQRLGPGQHVRLLRHSLCGSHRQQRSPRLEANRFCEGSQRKVRYWKCEPERQPPEKSLVCHSHHHHRLRRFRSDNCSPYDIQHLFLWLRVTEY